MHNDIDTNEDSGNPNPLYISDEAEYERLKAALSAGRTLSTADAERLAFMLGCGCVTHCDEDGDLENATAEIALLFACAVAAPASAAIREPLYGSALCYIDAAGSREDFAAAEHCLTKLRVLLESARDDKALSRVCANGLVLTIGNYLDCDPALLREARTLYGETRKLAERHAADPVMPAMLAWARRLFVREALYQKDLPQARALLRESAEALERAPDNALLAYEYADACHSLFLAGFKRDDAIGT